MPAENTPLPTHFTPAEVSSLFRSYIDRAKKNDIMWVRGIYAPKSKLSDKYTFAIDELQDKDNDCSIKQLVADGIRRQLMPGSLVAVGGVLEPYLFSNGTISVQLRVTRVETLQERPVSPDDLRRAYIARAKAEAGYKPVEADLAQRLLRGETPRVALLYAQSSITAADFTAGAAAAATQFVFDEHRVSFAESKALAAMLRQLDAQGYHAVALIRGGGTGLDALDAPEVLEVAAHMHTPLIAAVGHAADRLILKNLADKVVATPTDLGHFFAALVEHAAEVRTRSRAVLVEDVRKQYAQQLDEAKKQNTALLQRVDTLTRAQQEATKQFAAQQQESARQLAIQQHEAARQLAAQQQKFNEQLAASKMPGAFTFLLMFLALAAGILIGWLLLH